MSLEISVILLESAVVKVKYYTLEGMSSCKVGLTAFKCFGKYSFTHMGILCSL